MRRLSRAGKALVALGAVLSLLVITTSALVLYGRHSIQRGASWKGVRLRDDGLALVFRCDPASGIDHAYFFVSPWARVKLEKLNLHEPP
ncbi:MAG TPA: hypothetical protein VN914_09160 [Polyangia bacterium]|nr:hypothetical protein [Polyangia bacterium]